MMGITGSEQTTFTQYLNACTGGRLITPSNNALFSIAIKIASFTGGLIEHGGWL